jgi:hypothetical protein
MKAKYFLGSLMVLWTGVAMAQAPIRTQPSREPYIIPIQQQALTNQATADTAGAYIIPESQRGAPPPPEPTLIERLRDTSPRELLNPATLRSLFGGNP